MPLKRPKIPLRMRELEQKAVLREFSVLRVEFSVLQMMLKKIRQPEFLVMRKEFSIKTITRISSVWLKWVE